MRAALALPCCLTFACGPLQVNLPLPALEGIRTLVVELEDGDRLRLFAADLGAEEAVAPPAAFEQGEQVSLALHAYRAPLAALELDPGELAVAPRGTGRRLPAADLRYTSRLRGGRAEPWTELLPTSPWPDRWLVGDPPPPLCPTLRPEYSLVDGTLRFAERLSGREILLGTEDGRFLVAGSGGFRALPGRRAAEVHAALNQHGLWLAGEGGQLWRATVSSSITLTLVGASPRGERLRWLARPIVPRGGELYTLSTEGGLERFDQGTWTLVHRMCSQPNCATSGLLFPLGGEAVAFGPRGGNTLEQVTPEGVAPALSLPSGQDLSNGVWVPTMGALATVDDGPLLRFEPGVDPWPPLRDFDGRYRLNGLGAYQDGFAFGTKLGQLGLWTPGLGVCAPQHIGANDVLYVFELEGGEILVISGQRSLGLVNNPVLIVLRAEL